MALVVQIPHVTKAEFVASPTYLDLDDLVPGGSKLQESAELYNALLRATAWADNYAQQPLAAHRWVEQRRVRSTNRGDIRIPTEHGPVSQGNLFSLSYGATPKMLSPLLDLTGVWHETNGPMTTIVVSLAGPMGPQLGTLQLGSPSVNLDLYAIFGYVAGYSNTVLSTASMVGDVAIAVDNPIGVVPNQVLRIWDSPIEEAAVVSSTYVPATNPVTLTAPLRNAHLPAVGVSALPSEIKLAVIQVAMALLLRPGTSSDDPFADATASPVTSGGSSRQSGAGLIESAMTLIDSYRRVFR